ncbi:MAG: hypothetical protein WB511_06610, partial [Nitrososphaeraceae archaeon]
HYLTIQAKEQMKTHLEKVPIEFNNCLRGIDQILKSAWEIANKNTRKNDNNSNNNYNSNNNNTSLVTRTTDERLRLQALQLGNECYKHKIDLVTNATIIEDALKFVERNNGNTKKESTSNKMTNDNDKTIETNENTIVL